MITEREWVRVIVGALLFALVLYQQRYAIGAKIGVVYTVVGGGKVVLASDQDQVVVTMGVKIDRYQIPHLEWTTDSSNEVQGIYRESDSTIIFMRPEQQKESVTIKYKLLKKTYVDR